MAGGVVDLYSLCHGTVQDVAHYSTLHHGGNSQKNVLKPHIEHYPSEPNIQHMF